MKKFSTFALVLASLGGAFLSSSVQAQDVTAPTESNVKPLSKKCAFLPNAPDKHVVVKGDTLWDISGKFLRNPWCWPEVWGMNREDIRNPHWIYPKQIVYFDRVNGRLRLGNPVGTAKLRPQIRDISVDDNDAIAAIPNGLIEPYLVQPLVIGKDEFNDAPRIVSGGEDRVMMGQGDKLYTRGDLKGQTAFQVFRPGRALIDPETKAVLGYEAVFLGNVKLLANAKIDDGVDTFTITKSREEMGVGDRLVPIPPTPIINYVPHPPATDISARIMGVYGGLKVAGQYQVVSINRGSDQGIDVGTVLEIAKSGKIFADKTDNKKLLRLPDETYGQLFIFRTFKNISYGLIMQVTDIVNVGDSARNPER